MTCDSKRREQRLAARRADVWIHGVLRMRHQADDVARLVADAGDAVRGAVGVVGLVDVAVGRAVAEDDPSLVLEPIELGLVRRRTDPPRA